jgi:hypothetical protein
MMLVPSYWVRDINTCIAIFRDYGATAADETVLFYNFDLETLLG